MLFKRVPIACLSNFLELRVYPITTVMMGDYVTQFHSSTEIILCYIQC